MSEGRRLVRLDRLDLSFQAAELLDDARVEELTRLYRDGVAVDPIWVWEDGLTLYLADGYHRVAAAMRAGLTELQAEIQLGSYAEMEADWKAKLRAMLNQMKSE